MTKVSSVEHTMHAAISDTESLNNLNYHGPMASGHCLCGAVTFETTGDPLATAVCHCDHCQRQSGGAFSVNLIMHESQLSVTGELKAYIERGENNDDEYVRRNFCPTCGSSVTSELLKTAGIVAVKAGVLDDKSIVQPGVEVWCEQKQPWVSLPGIGVSLDRES
jgi:hypothetical protein